jgi:hypothetical protein
LVTDGVLRVALVAVALALGYGLDGWRWPSTIASYLTLAAAACGAGA